MKGDPQLPGNWFALARRDLEKARRDLGQGDVSYGLILLHRGDRGLKAAPTHSLTSPFTGR